MGAKPRIQIPSPALVLLVGPAGSGKSTLATRLFEPDEVLSSDAYRALLGDGEADQRATGAAFAALHRTARGRLRAGRRTVIDATNVQRGARRSLLAIARAAGVPAVAIVLALPLEVVVARNAGRRRVVDDVVIRRQAALLADALRDGALAAEGFDDILVLRDAAAADALTLA